MNQKHDSMPPSVKKLWRRLTITWSIAWLLGLLVFALVTTLFATRYFDQQVDARLRVQAIAIYGLAFFGDDGAFESGLLNYETDLIGPGDSVWFVEPGNPPIFHLGENDHRLPHSQLLSLSTSVVNSGEDRTVTGVDTLGLGYRLLAIPTFQGSSDTPRAAIVVAMNPKAATSAKWLFVVTTSSITVLLGVIGIGVGAFLAKSSLRPLSVFISRREQFLSAAAHELRTPLASMRAVVESAEAGNEPAETALGRVGPLVAKATENVVDLLLYARLNAERVQIVRSLFRLDLLVEKSIPEDAGVQLTAEAVTVECDSQLVETAVRNLVANALRHATEPAAVAVQVLGNRVIVENEGEKFPLKVIEDLAEQSAVSPSTTGSGLGLPTVQMIALLHGGSLILENTERGARATLVLN